MNHEDQNREQAEALLSATKNAAATILSTAEDVAVSKLSSSEITMFRKKGLLNFEGILKLVGMIAAVITLWFGMDKRLALLEDRLLQTRSDVLSLIASAKSLTENQMNIARIQDRQNFILEEIRKKGQ